MTKRPQRHADRSRSVTQLSIGEYLIRRLGDYSLRHVFGVPGDYNLILLDQLIKVKRERKV